MRLISVFQGILPYDMDHEVKPNDGSKTYTYRVRIERNPEAPRITMEDLQGYLQALKERMKAKYGPEVSELFYLGRRTVNGRQYVFLGRKRKGASGLKPTDRLPIYFDLQSQEAFIPESYLQRSPKRARYLIMTVLGALRQTRRSYIGRSQGGGRAGTP
jgi:hypothetical protein